MSGSYSYQFNSLKTPFQRNFKSSEKTACLYMGESRQEGTVAL